VIDRTASTPSRWQDAIVERVVRQTPRIVSVFLGANLGPFEAGQHVDVRLTAPDGYQAQRSYSIASAPGAQAIELAIERLEDGEVSPYFHDVAQPGDTIELRGPIGGHFIWRHEDGGPMLLIGGGSGIVPLMSMLRHRSAVAPETVALLVYSARTWDDLLYRDELLSMQERDSNFTLVLTTTRGARRRQQDLDRRLDRDLLSKALATWDTKPRHAYVCGSNAFVGAVTDALVLDQLPPRLVRTERYGGAE
jgi:ferredoxin-NADP reductase